MKIQINYYKSCFLLVLATLLFISCSSSDDEYQPFFTSYQGNTVELVIKQANGKEYNYDSLMTNKGIKIYGELSKKDLELRSVKANDGKTSIMFAADLPNTKSMSFNNEYTYGTGLSKVTIYLENQVIPIVLHYIYRSRDKARETVGINGIHIDSFELNGDIAQPSDDSHIHGLILRKNSKNSFELE